MRKNIVLMALVSFMFIIGLQVAEPVAAASWKVIDHGSDKFRQGNIDVTYKWVTYKKGNNYVVLKTSYYPEVNSCKPHYYLYLQKISKTKIKITEKTFLTTRAGKNKDINQKTYYRNTKLTAVQYYWRLD